MCAREKRRVVFRVSLGCIMSFATHPLFALVPGQEAALSREVVEGERIQVEGPPSSQRHPGLNDPQRNENSAEGADSLLQSRRRIPDGVYQACRKRWLATRFPSASLDELAAKVRAKYEELVLGPIQWPRLVGIDVEPMTLVYPAGYGSKATPQQIRTRRLNVRAVDGFGEERSVVAYYLNYDKVPLEHSRVILQVNGHFGANPSRMLIGLKGRGGISDGCPDSSRGPSRHCVRRSRRRRKQRVRRCRDAAGPDSSQPAYDRGCPTHPF